jgi:hypothetical protein
MRQSRTYGSVRGRGVIPVPTATDLGVAQSGAALAPTASIPTAYDEQHAITYLRLLDAEAEGADWQEVARIVLHIDPAREPGRARRAWEAYLARARKMTELDQRTWNWNRRG